MPDWLFQPRAAALLAALVVVAWLPGAAVRWMSDPRPGEGPRLVYVAAPSEAVTLSDPPELETPPLALQTEDAPQRLDLRGNEIVRPVARYGVDHRGALFEMHSPETEVPQLPQPEL